MQPWGAPVFRVRLEDVVLPIRTACGLPVRKFRIQSRRAMLSTRFLSLVTSVRGTTVLNALVNEKHSHICFPLVQVGEGSV